MRVCACIRGWSVPGAVCDAVCWWYKHGCAQLQQRPAAHCCRVGWGESLWVCVSCTQDVTVYIRLPCCVSCYVREGGGLHWVLWAVV